MPFSTPPTPDSASPAYAPAYASLDDYAAPAPTFHPQKFLTFLRRFWWVPMLTMILAIGGAIGFLVWLPPTFVSSARMWETEKLRLPGGNLFAEDPQSYMGTQTELLRSGKMWEMTLENLRTKGSNSVPIGKDGLPLPVKLNVNLAPRSSVFVVQARSSDPKYTQAYLDSLMNAYMLYKRSVRDLVSSETYGSISRQVEVREKDLKAAQEALTSFQRSNNLAILMEEGTIAGSYLARLKTQLSDLQLESQLLEATAIEQEANIASGTNATGSLLEFVRPSTTGTAASGSIERQSAVKEIELLRIQRERLSKNLRPKHPKIVKLDTDIERGKRIIEMYHNQTREQIASAQQALKMRIASVQASIQDWGSKVVEANSRIAEAEHLKMGITREQSVYDRLMSLLSNVDISKSIDQSTLAILEPASKAERTYRKEMMVLVLCLFSGLTLGLGLVLLIAVRDDLLMSMVDVNEHIGDCVLGQIPEMPLAKKGGLLAQMEDEDERHRYAESYRYLRSAILSLDITGDHPPKVLLVTSAVPDEGKSTISSNLARALALGGSRVLLVDADLRKGHLHDQLSLSREPGLVEVLSQPDQLDRFIQADPVTNLFFLGRGSTHWNPGDLFLNVVFDDLLARWRQMFDFILIDSSPIFAADDATTLASKVDGTLFVLRRGYSRIGIVREALKLLYHRRVNILGLILNRVDVNSRSYYYKYKSYYRSGKSDQIENTEKPK